MFFRTKCLSLVLLAASLLQLSGCQKSETPSPQGQSTANPIPTYKVGTDADFAPFEFKNNNGTPTGFTIEILQAIGEKAGFKVTIIPSPWKNLVPALNQGDIDIISASVTITEERAKTMDFSDLYFETRQLIIQKQSPNALSSAQQLTDKRIAVQIKTTADLIAQRIQTKDTDRIIRFETASAALASLLTDKIDFAISDAEAVRYFIKNNPDVSFQTLSDPDFPSEHYGFAVKKGNPALLKQINMGLEAIRQDGTYDAIYKKYFGQDTNLFQQKTEP